MTKTATPPAPPVPVDPVCPGCQQALPVTAFFATPLEPTGHTRRCRSCIFKDSARFSAEREARAERAKEGSRRRAR